VTARDPLTAKDLAVHDRVDAFLDGVHALAVETGEDEDQLLLQAYGENLGFPKASPMFVLALIWTIAKRARRTRNRQWADEGSVMAMIVGNIVTMTPTLPGGIVHWDPLRALARGVRRRGGLH
jgi:hypothetical protein